MSQPHTSQVVRGPLGGEETRALGVLARSTVPADQHSMLRKTVSLLPEDDDFYSKILGVSAFCK